MSIFSHFKTLKKTAVKEWDREHLKPVVLSSICTGEKTAGFEDEAGHFHAVMLVRVPEDLKAFAGEYGIDPDSIQIRY